MAEVKQKYYENGQLESEVFVINGKKMENIKNIIKMDNYILFVHTLMIS